MSRGEAARSRIGPAAQGILHDLPLLFHPVRLERLPILQPVGVRTRSPPEPAVEQVLELSRGTPSDIAPRSPRLILGAMGELVRQDGQIALAPRQQNDVVA